MPGQSVSCRFFLLSRRWGRLPRRLPRRWTRALVQWVSSASEDDPSLKLGGSAQQAEDTGANVGAAVGGAVGGVAALAVVTGVVVYCYRKKKAQAAKPPVAGVEVQSVKDEHI